jgi:hypothetical protein
MRGGNNRHRLADHHGRALADELAHAADMVDMVMERTRYLIGLSPYFCFLSAVCPDWPSSLGASIATR